MNRHRFDTLVKQVHVLRTRREGLRILLAGFGAGALGIASTDDAAACRRKGESCKKSTQCCSKVCNRRGRRGPRRKEKIGKCDCSPLSKGCKITEDCCDPGDVCGPNDCAEGSVCCRAIGFPCLRDCDCCFDARCGDESGVCERSNCPEVTCPKDAASDCCPAAQPRCCAAGTEQDCCQESEICCAAGSLRGCCSLDEQFCCPAGSGRGCCPPDEPVCCPVGSNRDCCRANEVCCPRGADEECAPDNTVCCPPGSRQAICAAGEQCCPVGSRSPCCGQGGACCPAGSAESCCPAGKVCSAQGCVNSTTCDGAGERRRGRGRVSGEGAGGTPCPSDDPELCCQEGDTCCTAGPSPRCCPAGTACTAQGCMPPCPPNSNACDFGAEIPCGTGPLFAGCKCVRLGESSFCARMPGCIDCQDDADCRDLTGHPAALCIPCPLCQSTSPPTMCVIPCVV